MGPRMRSIAHTADQPLYASCQCRGGRCAPSTCTCTVAYAADGRLLDAFLLSEVSAPVFECNSQCTCDACCPNRATQRAAPAKLRVAMTAVPGKGRGVFTDGYIRRGSFVGEYVGEIVTVEEAKKRLGCLGNGDPCYLVTFREHSPSGAVLTTNVDATHCGNAMRFVNHSCAPNASMVAVRSDSIVPRLCLFAARDIDAGEEIGFSYFGQTVAGPQDDRALSEHTFGRKQCMCGAKECVGFLPLEL